MLVLQQIKVLPPGSNFTLKDEGRTELQGFISESDGSLGFLTPYESDKYYKIYQNFKVIELKGVLGPVINNIQTIEYIIEVR